MFVVRSAHLGLCRIYSKWMPMAVPVTVKGHWREARFWLLGRCWRCQSMHTGGSVHHLPVAQDLTCRRCAGDHLVLGGGALLQRGAEEAPAGVCHRQRSGAHQVQHFPCGQVYQCDAVRSASACGQAHQCRHMSHVHQCPQLGADAPQLITPVMTRVCMQPSCAYEGMHAAARSILCCGGSIWITRG